MARLPYSVPTYEHIEGSDGAVFAISKSHRSDIIIRLKLSPTAQHGSKWFHRRRCKGECSHILVRNDDLNNYIIDIRSYDLKGYDRYGVVKDMANSRSALIGASVNVCEGAEKGIPRWRTVS